MARQDNNSKEFSTAASWQKICLQYPVSMVDTWQFATPSQKECLNPTYGWNFAKTISSIYSCWKRFAQTFHKLWAHHFPRILHERRSLFFCAMESSFHLGQDKSFKKTHTYKEIKSLNKLFFSRWNKCPFDSPKKSWIKSWISLNHRLPKNKHVPKNNLVWIFFEI